MSRGRGHVPYRTCVLCGTKAPKRNLLRVVATPDGAVQVDPAGRLAGRGAYLCSDPQCRQRQLQRPRLNHALRTPISEVDWAKLMASLEAVGKGDQEGATTIRP